MAARKATKKTTKAKKATPRTAPARKTAASSKPESDSGAQPEMPAATEVVEPVPAEVPVVGIGASAGGLEALEAFLGQVPSRSGVAFVIVQHLDPGHKGPLVELLQRKARIPVTQARDRQVVEPDKAYVIPPNRHLAIQHGRLRLFPQTAPSGVNLPIDYFFRSLAQHQREKSVGVVLSGMGSDGTLGLRAIKEMAGTTFVQSIESARFDGMPRSAIDAGLADVVAPAIELPGRIIAYLKQAPSLGMIEDKQSSVLDKFFVLLRAQTGNDFSLYKKSTIQRRVERRMTLHQIDKVPTYIRYLRDNPREIELLFKELLIGVTSFFRDPHAWDQISENALPDLIRARAPHGLLRAWVPGCSTGEEAFSLAMVLMEARDKLKHAGSLSFQIFATDLDRDAIEKARLGLFPANIVADVSPERLNRFFLQDERGHRVRKEVREAVVFAPQNVIMDPPFTRVDIVSCRNLLIYLSSELQKKLIPLFHYALNPGGLLFLGSAETAAGFSALFESIEGKARLYRRLQTGVGAPAVEFPISAGTSALDVDSHAEPGFEAPPTNLGTLVERVIAQRFSPASILTTDKGDILYISGRTGKYLEPPVGKANLNVFAMAREGLRLELSTAFSGALRSDGPVTIRSIRVRTNGSAQTVDLTVQKLDEPKDLRGTMMIVIDDVATPAEVDTKVKQHRGSPTARIEQLERDLQESREEVQTTREEMQTSQEELKSTNEELQSTNEELQSSNEELTTSKEEMQSMNEELQTVNHELQAKVDELSRANNDMKNLLNSTDIATLFLDGELRVRRFTTQTSKLIKLIPADAGRLITDIATNLDYDDLADDARDVLRTLVFKEKQVASRDKRWFMVRIMPYRTLDNVIDGVVITFTDGTATKHLEETLREQASQLEQLLESLPTLVWVCGADGTCEFLNRRWLEYTGVPKSAQFGFGWLEQVHAEDRERIRTEWRAAIASGQPLDTEFRLRRSDATYRWFKARSVPISASSGAIVKWCGTFTDVDDLKSPHERGAPPKR